MAQASLIDGRAIAEKTHAETRERVAALKTRGIEPGLVFIRVGEDPASQVYVGMKAKTSQQLGIRSDTHVLKESSSEQELLALIAKLNTDRNCHAILVQAPLPRQIDGTKIYSAVSPEKDVDGFHPVNMGKLLLGDRSGFVPCTPAGVHELLIQSETPLKGAEVVVLGRGNIVGKPMAALLMQKETHANATVTVCHSHTTDIGGHCRRADVIVAAIGMAHFVKADMVRQGATVIDVGVNRIPDAQAKSGSRLVGDVDFENVKSVAARITPNPGGVGPMTIAMLMRNTVRAAENLTR